jgi:5-methyltetrahydropteroyltriglutamate--homocysteine methyltransferase
MLPGIAVKFHGHTEDAAMQVQIPFSVTEKISARECPGVREYKYAAAHTDMPIKVTLPSPMMILGLWNAHSKAAYPDPFLLAADAAEAVATWMRQLADAGCTYIQIDAPELNEAYVDARVRTDYEQRGISSERFLSVGTELLGSLADIQLSGVTKALHVCRGNGTQSWIAEGGYEEFSRVVFRRASGFDIFHLEYDDDRSGSFEPLRHLPKDKVAVLGLVSTKWTRMESPEELSRRIHEAARFHPLSQLALATQCGFASAAETAADRRITDATQLAKLRMVAAVARDIWR